MTFQNFGSYKEWCINVTTDQELTIRTLDQEPNSILIENMRDSDPILLMEIVLSAYDSGFVLGGFFANEDNGSMLIYE